MTPAPIYREYSSATCDASTPPSTVTDFKIDQDVCVAVVGVGFVGESLLKEFGRVFRSVGFDVSDQRIESLKPAFESFPKVELTSEEASLGKATHYLICVPTLLRSDRSVNLDYVYAAVTSILRHARPGSSIIVESSVSVGTTRRILGPYRHLFHCGMSPERVDPGRSSPSPHMIPKIVSGLGERALKHIHGIYSKVFDTVVPVSRPEVAEMTKLFENCYRMVNIAYVNEMSDACRSHGIDPFEMIEAASSKPYGFQPFYPGLGVGGHCIPVNPFYLFANNKNLPVLERSTKIMWNRPKKLARNFHRRCSSQPEPRRSSLMPRILVVGVGFKRGQSVISCSPGLSFAQTLKITGCARLAFYDPLVPQSDVAWMEKLDSKDWDTLYIDSEFDGIAICTQQDGVDFSVTERLQKTFVRSFV